MMNTKSIFSAGLVLLALFFACDKNPAGVILDDYEIQAVLVKDLQASTQPRIDVSVRKNDTLFTGADVLLDTIPLDINGDVYEKVFQSTDIVAGQDYVLSIIDNDVNILTYQISLPASFTIEITDPASKIYNTSGTVKVTRDVAAGADNYIIASEPLFSQAVGAGYVAYTPGDELITIPPDAYVDINDDRVLGEHQIAVAAYAGAPINSEALFFDIPALGNPADNVSMTHVSGRVSGIVLSARQILDVQAIQ
jgi:hypothetical protein